MIRRVAKRGFFNKFAPIVGEVNVADLERRFEAGAEVTPATLKELSLANYRYDVLKVLGDGEITKSLTVSAHKFGKSAKEKIEKAGGKCVVLATAKPVVKNKMGSKKAAQIAGK